MSMSAHEPFVMVPVPVEHQLEFQELVLHMVISGAARKWNAEQVEQLLEALDGEQLALVDHLTDCSFAARQLTIVELGEELGSGERTLSIIKSINAIGVELERPVFILVNETEENSRVSMPPSIARLVRAARPQQ